MGLVQKKKWESEKLPDVRVTTSGSYIVGVRKRRINALAAAMDDKCVTFTDEFLSFVLMN